ncbi:MAG: hypothetical protein QCI00_05505 [Candidatus Thermoplasmatota archaeon]|nr:hypothetical protein [Candidatus Thermoplasmatota archaeon]
MKKNLFVILLLFLITIFLLSGCVEEKSRADIIPDDAIKVTPETDLFPPVVHDLMWADPIPVPGPINTAGAEDAGFITPDGNTLIFFFTPDVTVPPNEQLFDGVTGLWWSQRQGNSWTEPTRIKLGNTIALDGAPFYQDNTLWFASARAGNYRDLDFWTAEYVNNKWTNIKNTDQLLNEIYEIGEMHVSSDEKTLYFDHKSGNLFTTQLLDGVWTEPEEIGPPVNTAQKESRPFVNQDETELWFHRPSGKGYAGAGIFRSIRNPDGTWGEPVEIVSNFAAEPSLDAEGNLYFSHHFFDEDLNMIEADIYVCYKQ